MGELFRSIQDGMGWLLAFFYSLVPNAGFAIVMLTVLVRLALFPLTAKQAKSMIAMQRAQPEIKRLQAKYKHDRQQLNEELMKFYRENKINPLGGCLPLVAQMPVFIALYQTLRHIEDHLPSTGRLSEFYRTACAGELAECAKPTLKFFGMNLAQSASSVQGGFVDALPYFFLVALVVGSAFLQQRQTMRYQTQPNPQMQMIAKIMPPFFGLISISIPAGVVLYFFTSNLWQMGQQELVYRAYGTPGTPAEPKAAPPATGGGPETGPAGRTDGSSRNSGAPGAKESGEGTRSGPGARPQPRRRTHRKRKR